MLSLVYSVPVLLQYAEVIGRDFADTVFVLQTATINGRVMTGRNAEIMKLYKTISGSFNDVRIIPQHQIIWGVK